MRRRAADSSDWRMLNKDLLDRNTAEPVADKYRLPLFQRPKQRRLLSASPTSFDKQSAAVSDYLSSLPLLGLSFVLILLATLKARIYLAFNYILVKRPPSTS
jgi:hypothetical protein